MKSARLFLLFIALAGPAQAQTPHACSGDALARARTLVRFHLADPGMEAQIADGTAARRIADVATLTGKGKLDVLEVTTDVYKARYRMRFLYAQLPGTCALLGQEILDASDPY